MNATHALTANRGYRVATALLLLVSALVLTAGTARTSVFDRDEARFALAVREMRARGELVLPTNWGEPRYHKPILVYWCALAAERVLGENELAWRLPSIVAGLATIAATMALARRRFGERVALRAGAVLATSLVFVVEARTLTADALLLLATTLSCWAWLERREGGTGWALLFWVALALGILAKAVNVVFLAALAAALAWLRLRREGRAPRGVLVLLFLAACAAAVPALGVLGPLSCAAAAAWVLFRARGSLGAAWRGSGAAWGLPLCLALLAPWLVPALVRTHGAFLSEGLGHHMLARSASAFDGHRGFPGYYVLTGALALFPWAPFVPAALAAAWRDARCEFFLAWILGPWALLECLASKLPHYVLITLPALAVLVALEWERRGVRPSPSSRAARAVERVLAVVPCLLLAAAGAWLWCRGAPELHLAAGLLSGAALLVGLVLATALGHPDARPFALACGGALVLYLVLGACVLPALEPFRPAKPLGRELARLARPGETIHLAHWRPESVGCYLPAGHDVVQDPQELERLLAAGEPGLFVVEGERLERFLAQHPGAWEHLAAVHGLALFGPEEVVVLRRGAR